MGNMYKMVGVERNWGCWKMNNNGKALLLPFLQAMQIESSMSLSIPPASFLYLFYLLISFHSLCNWRNYTTSSNDDDDKWTLEIICFFYFLLSMLNSFFLHKINSAHKIYSLIHKMNEGMSLTQRKFRENWNWKKALEAVFLCVLVTSTFLLISLYSLSLFYSLMNIEQRIHFSLFLLFCSFILLLNEVFHEISTQVFLEYSDDSLIFLSVLRLSIVS